MYVAHNHPGGDACDDNKEGHELTVYSLGPSAQSSRSQEQRLQSVSARAIPLVPTGAHCAADAPTGRTQSHPVSVEHMLNVRALTDELADELRKN